MLRRRCFGFTTRNFEGLNFKVEFFAIFSEKFIQQVCERQKHLLMRLDLNFYAYNYKIHGSEAQNANASKFEKSIFGGSRSCIFLKDFVRNFGHYSHVLYCTGMWVASNTFGL